MSNYATKLSCSSSNWTFSMTPRVPDNLTVSPVLNTSVAKAAPTMHGKPYSRAITAPKSETDSYINCHKILSGDIEYRIIVLCFTPLPCNASYINLPCDISPPSSVTTPVKSGKYGDQPMSVACVINTSPRCNWPICKSI